MLKLIHFFYKHTKLEFYRDQLFLGTISILKVSKNNHYETWNRSRQICENRKITWKLLYIFKIKL